MTVPRTLWTAAAVALLALVALVGAASAQAPSPASAGLTLSQSQRGWISARVVGPPDTTVSIQELRPSGPAPLMDVRLPSSGTADVAQLERWSCDRRRRRFAVAGTDPAQAAAVAEIRTPSCRDRLALEITPGRPRAGRRTSIVVRDRWRIGGAAARVCLVEPDGGRQRCRTVRLDDGVSRVAVRVSPPRAGRWNVTLRAPAQRITRPLAVRPPARRLRVLATGDSMIQIVDGFLRERLAVRQGVEVHSDAHISTGISKTFMLNWPSHARASAQTLHPDVTVVFLGANDGFPMGTPGGRKAACCDAAWEREYARRAQTMMRAYARGGEGTVYWLLLPAARDRKFRQVFDPVNRALREAARAYPGTVRLVDLRATFTPGGRFRQHMRWHGRTVSVRQPDGVHLSVAGAEIAADVIVRAMRRDGVVR